MFIGVNYGTDQSRETVEFFPEFAAADEQFLRYVFVPARGSKSLAVQFEE